MVINLLFVMLWHVSELNIHIYFCTGTFMGEFVHTRKAGGGNNRFRTCIPDTYLLVNI